MSNSVEEESVQEGASHGEAARALSGAESRAGTSTAAPMTNYRWWMVFLGAVIIAICYMDRSAIAYAVKPIMAEFNINHMEFGYIAAAFGVGYVIMTLGGGIIVDKWGARKVWAGSAVAWSVVTAALGLASGFWIMFGIRALLGLAEGPCFPALTRMVTDWLPMSERAKSTAIGLAAVPIASVIGAPLISHLIAAVGWKAMFFILGTFGVVWAVVWYFVFTDYPETSKHVNAAELKFIREGQETSRDGTDEELRSHHLAAGKTTWAFMLLNPSLAANNFAFFSFGYLLFFALTWLPGYLEQTFSLKVKEVGWFLVAPWLTSAVLLTLAGFLSDYLWKKTGSIRASRTHMIWICQLLSALCFIPVTMSPTLDQAMIMISLGVGLGLMPNAAFYAINSDLAKDRAATSLGLMDCFFAAAGVLAPIVTGFLVDKTGNFNAPIHLMIGMTFAAVIAVVLFQHPDKDMKTAAGA